MPIRILWRRRAGPAARTFVTGCIVTSGSFAWRLVTAVQGARYDGGWRRWQSCRSRGIACAQHEDRKESHGSDEGKRNDTRPQALRPILFRRRRLQHGGADGRAVQPRIAGVLRGTVRPPFALSEEREERLIASSLALCTVHHGHRARLAGGHTVSRDDTRRRGARLSLARSLPCHGRCQRRRSEKVR